MISKKRFNFLFGILIIFLFSLNSVFAFNITISSPVQDETYYSLPSFNYSTDANVSMVIGNIIYANGSDIYPIGDNWTTKESGKYWRSVSVSSTGQYQTAVAGGTSTGYIYISTDYGNTWTQKGSSRYWTDISVSSTGQYQTAVAGGTSTGYIYISTDYGNNWTQKESSRYWSDISVSSTGQYQTAVVGGTYGAGYIYISTDYGNNWTQKESSRYWRSVSVSSTGQYQTAVVGGTYTGYIYISTDYGNNWTQKGSTGYWKSVSVSSTGQYQTAVNNEGSSYTEGYIYISTDYGNNWTQKVTSGTTNGWSGVSLSSTGQYQTAVQDGSYGYMFISTDYGNNWTQKQFDYYGWNGISLSSTGQYQTAVVTSDHLEISNNSMVSFLSNTSANYNILNFSKEGNFTAEVWVLNASGIADNTSVDFNYDIIYPPSIGFKSPTPSNGSYNAIFTVNVTIAEFTPQNVTYNFNGTETFFDTANESLIELENGNWSFTYNQTGLVTGQTYTYNVSATNSSGYTITTETRTIYGTNHLAFYDVNSTPDYSSSNDIDPGVDINISARIYDSDNLFDFAILQWKNSTDTEWNNVSMENTTEISYYTWVLGNFTLPEYEGDITFRILANNIFGDFAYSSDYIMASFWDCTWSATSDLGATAGYNENKFIGNITINNTGDYNHSSHCSLDFRLTYNLEEGRIYFDDKTWKPSDTYTIIAGETQSISVNATFLSELDEEYVTITIDEMDDISSTAYSYVSATLISNQEGPYLYQTITTYPTSVYLTPGNFSLSGYLRNLMGSSEVDEYNTAYNVTFYWTLPSGFTNSSGSTIINYTNITDKNINYNDIGVGFSDLASMNQGIETISLNSYGYDLSGDLIQDVGGNTLLTNQINISFLCYNLSDGICVSACGYLLDSDCSVPETPSTEVTTTGGGGGGGGSRTIGETISSNENLQLVRGKENSLVVEFKNTDANHSIYDANFSVSGNLAKYILVDPSYIAEIPPKTSVNVTLYITSPTYISLGKNKLSVTLSGRKIGSYQDQKNLVIEIHDISTQEAMVFFEELKNLSEEMKSKNITITEELDSKMNETEECLSNFSYELLVENYNFLKSLMNSALNAKQIIEEISSLINIAIEKGIDVSGSNRLVQTAILALNRGEYEEALSRANEAKTTYALEVKGEFGNLSYYLKNNYREISLGVVLLFISGFAFYKFGKLNYIKTKIKDLKKEEKILEDLIRLVQKETFIKKQMSIEEYHETLIHYENRMVQIIKKIIRLENQKYFLLKFVPAIKKLSVERGKILGLIKELQRDYMEKKEIETNTYDLRLKSYNKRIGEIDSEIANYEAKKAKKNLKKGEIGE
ncbi:hypothetical protein M0R72_16075 [Candidatus Pacearchaeota archaeon]|jgi:hypothetical protein|nr:hypothetical protein [Candidatus Pacearchaeota archaeon]